MQPTLPPEQIRSERVTLKRHSLELAERMIGYVDQDRRRLREFLPWVDSTLTLEDELGYIKMTHEKWASHELFDYGIFRNSDSLYMGNCGVHSIAWPHNRCELGYWILGTFEGQGFVSEGVRTLEKALFEMGFNRIEIHCSSSNARSASVPRATGFQLEATLREEAIENGRYRDTLIFGKLKADWEARGPHVVG